METRPHECTPRMTYILAVDDNPLYVKLLKAPLQSAGFEVVTAGNGREALAEFFEPGRTISAVVTDLVMPVMSGIELARELWNKKGCPPIIAVSSCLHEFRAADVERLGFAAALQKPFESAELVNTVRKLISPQPVATHLDLLGIRLSSNGYRKEEERDGLPGKYAEDAAASAELALSIT